MSTSASSVIDDVFEFLSVAEQLERTNPIEAATKYYEAIYLMQQFVQRMPMNTKNEKVKELLQEKILHYESVASRIMQNVSSDGSSRRSPASSQGDASPSSWNVNDGMALLSLLHHDSISPRSPLSNMMIPLPNHSSSSSSHLASLHRTNDATVPTGGIDTLLHQANSELSQAMDFDERRDDEDCKSEAVEKYMRAAEGYLQAMQWLSKQQPHDATTKEGIKKRLQQTLDRVEVLKAQKVGSVHHPSPQPSMNHNPPGDLSVASGHPSKRSGPATGQLTKEEVEILKHSSVIASGLFLPWSDHDAQDLARECRRHSKLSSSSSGKAAALFTDPDGFLPLSAKQKEQFHCWARPSDILRVRQQHAILSSMMKRTSPGHHRDPIMIKAITPYSIQQKFITDCSFIASLCICANYEQRFRKQLITSILYPQDEQGVVLYNPQGKYMVKLWFNGVPRCVMIDDYLPIDKYGNLLCSQTSHSSNVHNSSIELWVSLIEKAYMKLCGGYDFPGSNSGVDLFSLTGWIPERIHFSKDQPDSPGDIKDFETPAERVWERIYSASAYGDCLITVSTQVDITEEEAARVGLVTGHAYAVLAVLQTKNGTRLLQLKNPWAHKGWKGRYSCFDTDRWASASFRTEVGYDPAIAAKQDDGVFWICWEDILCYFRNFHLSWNPSLFCSRFVLHGHWSKDQGPMDDTFNVGENPQYFITFSDIAIQKKATFWILISRHVSKQEQEGEEVRCCWRNAVVVSLVNYESYRLFYFLTQVKDYLTIHLHRQSAKRERIWYPGRAGNCVLNGCYTNNPHALIRYDVQDLSDKYLALVLSQYKKCNGLNYTLSCYCTEAFSLSQPEKTLEHQYKFSSTWTTYSAGGPIGEATYPTNPQYSIFVPSHNKTTARSSSPAKTILQLQVSTTTTTAVNALLVPVRSYGDRITQAVGEPLIDTGKYRHGFVVSDRAVVPAGAYALVISNFHAGQTGFYNVQVSSNSSVLKIEKMGHLTS
jgi:calpain-7